MFETLETAERIGRVFAMVLKIVVLFVALLALFQGRREHRETTRERAVIMRALTAQNNAAGNMQTMEVSSEAVE